MNHGWIATYGSKDEMSIQISFASQGGSGSATPDLSIEEDDIDEVDDIVDEVYKRMKDAGFNIEYGPADEPWGVRRFYVRDPYNQIVNILAHNKN